LGLLFTGLGSAFLSYLHSCSDGTEYQTENARELSSSASGNELNILLILVDQMRFPVGFSPEMRLPNFERLKQISINFTSHFISAVPCSPSRASLFTGLYSFQHKVFSNVVGRSNQPDLSRELRTIGNFFQSFGYQTPYFGRWHLSRRGTNLNAYGFEQMTRDYRGVAKEWALDYDPPCVDSACSWLLSRNSRKNWFLTVSIVNPHDITKFSKIDFPVPRLTDTVPDNWKDQLQGKPSTQKIWSIKCGLNSLDQFKKYMDYYYYFHLQMDDLLGRILDSLEKSGQFQNTIIVFTSDHGDLAGSHRLFGKVPCVYDEQNRIPLLISHPFFPAREIPALTSNIDLFPTLAGLAGLNSDLSWQLPGLDLSRIISGDQQISEDRKILFFNRWIRYSLKRAANNINSLRNQNFIFAHYFNEDFSQNEYEYYDLKSDPFQMNNLASNLLK